LYGGYTVAKPVSYLNAKEAFEPDFKGFLLFHILTQRENAVFFYHLPA
jgi:hypothetical protein